METKITTVYVCEFCGLDDVYARYILDHEFDCLSNPHRERDSREMLGDKPMCNLSAAELEWSEGRDRRKKTYVENGLTRLSTEEAKNEN